MKLTQQLEGNSQSKSVRTFSRLISFFFCSLSNIIKTTDIKTLDISKLKLKTLGYVFRY